MKEVGRWFVQFALPPLVLLLLVIVVWDRAVAFWDLTMCRKISATSPCSPSGSGPTRRRKRSRPSG